MPDASRTMRYDTPLKCDADAAHAASEIDDYDGAAPEGFATSVLFIGAALAVVGIAAYAVFR